MLRLRASWRSGCLGPIDDRIEIVGNEVTWSRTGIGAGWWNLEIAGHMVDAMIANVRHLLDSARRDPAAQVPGSTAAPRSMKIEIWESGECTTIGLSGGELTENIERCLTEPLRERGAGSPAATVSPHRPVV